MDTTQTATDKKAGTSKKWIVIAGAALGLICLCLVIIGALAIPRLLKASSNGSISYSGIANKQLKSDTLNLIIQYEQAQNGCNDVTLFLGNMMIRPEQTTDGSWSEVWQVNACSASHMYNINFTPDGVGGTYISVSPIDQ